jgi:hypothetical protein
VANAKKDRLRAIINMLADEKSAHAAAHILRNEAAKSKLLVSDFILECLAAEDLALIRAKLKEMEQERQRQERERQERERREQARDPWTDVDDEHFNPRGGRYYLVDIIYETDRAYLIAVDPDIWIPKSQSKLFQQVSATKHRLWVKDWIAREKNIRM